MKLLFAFTIAAMVVCGLVFVAANTNTQTIDTYGNVADTTQSTDLLTGITNTGTAAATGLVILFSCLAIIGSVFLVRQYSH